MVGGNCEDWNSFYSACQAESEVIQNLSGLMLGVIAEIPHHVGYLGIIAESDLVHPTSIKISGRVKKRFASAMSCPSFLHLELGSMRCEKGQKRTYIFLPSSSLLWGHPAHKFSCDVIETSPSLVVSLELDGLTWMRMWPALWKSGWCCLNHLPLESHNAAHGQPTDITTSCESNVMGLGI